CAGSPTVRGGLQPRRAHPCGLPGVRASASRGCRMTILLLTEVFPPRTGGSGRWFWEVYRRLPREEVVVAAGECPGHEAFDQTHGLRLTRLSLTLPSWGLLGWRELRDHGRLVRAARRLARAEGVRTIHCGKCLPEGLVALALRWWTGLPYTCYVHGEEMK